jgi:hypothetical protein
LGRKEPRAVADPAASGGATASVVCEFESKELREGNNHRKLCGAGLMRRTGEDVITIGHALIRQKAALPHGSFLPWIAAEFDTSQRAAYRFINVAERYGWKLASLASLNLEAIYEPAAPSSRRRTSASSGPDALEVPRQDRPRRQSPLERGAAA